MQASEVHVPRDLASLFNLMRRNPQALLLAGGTGILREQGQRSLDFPPVIIAIHDISELCRLVLTERFLEIGACVTLSDLAAYNPGTIQPALLNAVKGISTVPIRNLATIGGNIACSSRFMDLWPVLACLDSLVEIRNPEGAKWININRFSDESGSPSLPSGAVITRIRIPLERWDVNIVVKMGQHDYPSPETSVLCATARTGKGIVNDFHLVMAGEHSFRSRELESAIVGRRLPLPENEIKLLSDEYRKQYKLKNEVSGTGIGRLPELALKTLAR
ncbi:MAG: FAD binding domain-containing protein [Rectinemataceae bacterium]|nr:FAD binding domain-containing protein [Rectinemataceae bacterium]